MPSLVAARKRASATTTLVHGSSLDRPFDDDCFDTISSSDALERRSLRMPGFFKHLVEGLSDLAGLPLPVMRCFTSHQMVVLTK